MTAPNTPDPTNPPQLPRPGSPATPYNSPGALDDPNAGYSPQATHQRMPNETAEDYQRRRQALELETESRRLQLAKHNAKAARIGLIADRLINAVYYLIGALEILLGLRLILRVSGANTDNVFASFIYNLSEPFVAPFSTLFVSPTAEGSRYIFDVNLLVAMLVYALLGLLASRLIRVLIGDTSR